MINTIHFLYKNLYEFLFCVMDKDLIYEANALLRGRSRLEDFEEKAVGDSEILSFTKKITVTPDPQLDKRGHTALDMQVVTVNGDQHLKQIDIPPGFPGNPLSQEDHVKRYWDCIESAPVSLASEDAEKIPDLVGKIEEIEDVRTIIPRFLRRP